MTNTERQQHKSSSCRVPMLLP